MLTKRKKVINLATKKNAAKPAAKKDNSKKPAPTKPLDEREVLKKKIADGEEAVEQLEKALKDRQKELAKDKASRKNAVKLFRTKLEKEVQELLKLIYTKGDDLVAQAVAGVILREDHALKVGYDDHSRHLYEYANAFGKIEYDEKESCYKNRRSSRNVTLECWDEKKRNRIERTIVGKGVIIRSPDMTEKNFESIAIVLAHYYRINKNIEQAIQKTKALFEAKGMKYRLYDDMLFEYLYDHS